MKTKGKTFSHQRELPALPVPDLSNTMDRFLDWVQPLLSCDEFKDLTNDVKNFKHNGEGEKLQGLLSRWSEREDIHNWLEPFWSDGYLRPRCPTPINSNVFYLLNMNESLASGNKQCERASLLIHALVLFCRSILEETLDPELLKGHPLCMNPYSLLFSTTRIPGEKVDLLRLPDRGSFPTSKEERHITVLSKGRIFSLEVIRVDGEILSPQSLLSALEEIKSYCEELPLGDSLGILTTAKREVWASLREELLRFCKYNGLLLDHIERSLFTLCLDDSSSPDKSDLGWNMLAGDPTNRWFDKSVQLIVDRDGQAAVNMEHSAIDGTPMVRAAAFISKLEGDLEPFKSSASSWKELPFRLSNHIKDCIFAAKTDFISFGNNTILRTFDFQDLDKDRIKSAGLSPDGVVQMSIQLAQYRALGHCYNTYEPAMMRFFYHGRTEAIRVVSPQSLDFVYAMSSGCTSSNDKFVKLKKATEEHVLRSRLCKEGQGVDRHLLGLKKMWSLYGDDPIPPIFNSIGYERLCENYISTSTTSADGLYMAGFGPVMEDGFGIRYVHKPGLIRFVCTSRSHRLEKLESLMSELRGALLDISRII